MEEKLIGFETAKLAKEKGFNWKTHMIWMFGIPHWKDKDWCFVKEWYHTERDYLCDIPLHEPWCYSATQAHLQKWLREVHKIQLSITLPDSNNMYDYHGYYKEIEFGAEPYRYSSYEEALEAGLIMALKQL